MIREKADTWEWLKFSLFVFFLPYCYMSNSAVSPVEESVNMLIALEVDQELPT